MTGLLAKVGSIASGVGIAMMAWDVGNILLEWAKQSKTFNDQLERMQTLIGWNPTASLKREIFDAKTGSIEEQKTDLQAQKTYYEYLKKHQLPVWVSTGPEDERTEFSVNVKDSFASNLKNGYRLEAHQPGMTVHAGAYDAKNGTKAGFYSNPEQLFDTKFQSEVNAQLENVNLRLGSLTKAALSPANEKSNQAQSDWTK